LVGEFTNTFLKPVFYCKFAAIFNRNFYLTGSKPCVIARGVYPELVEGSLTSTF